MSDINSLFPSKYLKSADIKGHEPTVVMSHIEVEDLGDDTKPVLYFQGKEKGMVLNRTNADAISELYGIDYDEWAGREITLFVMKVRGPNGMTDGLRVKAPKRKPAAKPKPQMKVEQRDGYQLATTENEVAAPENEEVPF